MWITPALMLAAVLASPPFTDAGPPGCAQQVVERGDLRLSTHWHSRLGKCSLSVGPRDAVAPARSFTLGSDGRVMVFNTFLPVDDEGAPVAPDHPDHAEYNRLTRVTGARVFWVFPRVAPLGARLRDGKARVRLPNGAELIFALDGARLLGATGLSVRQAPEVARDNEGGVELGARDGLVLDLGFRMGADPATLTDHTATFVDGAGHRCTVSVGALFRIEDEEPIFRYVDDASLLAWLQGMRRGASDPGCQALDIRPLKAAAVAQGTPPME